MVFQTGPDRSLKVSCQAVPGSLVSKGSQRFLFLK